MEHHSRSRLTSIITTVLVLSILVVCLTLYDLVPTPTIYENLTEIEVQWRDSPDVFVTTTRLPQRGLKASERQALYKTIRALSGVSRVDAVNLLKLTIANTRLGINSTLSHLLEVKVKYHCKNCTRESPPSLPILALGANATLEYDETWNGFSLPLIGVSPSGRLGNIMGEYATIYALHKIFNVSAVLTSKQKHEFHGHFPYLSLPVIKIENTKKWTTLHRGNDYNYVALELAAAGLLGPKCFLQDDWPFEMQIFNTYRDDILREFAFSDQLILKADAILADERRLFNSTSPITFIGVHIRRGDYPKYMKSQYSTKANLSYVKYLARAIEHYRGLHDNIIFIVASDDRPHARTLFMSLNHTKVFIADGTAFEDMCLLSRCNHSIITLGSFGFWTGYFSPGTTTYPDFMSTTSREYFLSRARYERAQIENFIALPYT